MDGLPFARGVAIPAVLRRLNQGPPWPSCKFGNALEHSVRSSSSRGRFSCVFDQAEAAVFNWILIRIKQRD